MGTLLTEMLKAAFAFMAGIVLFPLALLAKNKHSDQEISRKSNNKITQDSFQNDKKTESNKFGGVFFYAMSWFVAINIVQIGSIVAEKYYNTDIGKLKRIFLIVILVHIFEIARYMYFVARKKGNEDQRQISWIGEFVKRRRASPRSQQDHLKTQHGATLEPPPEPNGAPAAPPLKPPAS